MRIRKIRGFLLFAVLAFTPMIGLMVFFNPSYKAVATTRQGKGDKNITEPDQLPLVVFSASKPATPTEQTLRYYRSSHYDKSYVARLDEVRPDTLERSRISHFWVNMPALPTDQSSAVIIGDIIDGKAYLSNDQTAAYSEFTIHVKKSLKRDVNLSEDNIIAEREGADIQLPDGRILRYRIADQGTPRIGRNYVFFLSYNDDGKDYHIVTAYELRGSQVFPLDNTIGRFAAYTGADKDIFLSAVQEAITHPSQQPQDIKPVN